MNGRKHPFMLGEADGSVHSRAQTGRGMRVRMLGQETPSLAVAVVLFGGIRNGVGPDGQGLESLKKNIFLLFGGLWFPISGSEFVQQWGRGRSPPILNHSTVCRWNK